MTDLQSNNSWAFGDWWSLLNGELDAAKQPQSVYGEARYYYAANYSPFAAAGLIVQDRLESDQQAIHQADFDLSRQHR